jgi:hypothetical protein
MSETSSGEGWALPGSAVDPERSHAEARGPAGGPAVGGPARAGVGVPERPGDGGTGGLLSAGAAGTVVPRVDLRPMTAADIIDGAFEVVRARALRILAFTAVLATPVHLLLAFWQRDATGGVGPWDMIFGWDDPETQQAIEEESSGFGDFVQLLAGSVLSGLVLAAVAVAIAYQMGSWVAGRDAPAGELAAAVGRRSWALVASWVIVHVAEIPGLLLCLVGVLFIMPFFVAVAPVIGAERAGPITAVKRSVRLTRARYWPTMGIAVLTGLVAVLLSLALSSWLVLPVAVWGWEVAWPLVGLVNIMSTVITTPFVAAAAVLLYLDLRVRNEGLDLELAARETFAEVRS